MGKSQGKASLISSHVGKDPKGEREPWGGQKVFQAEEPARAKALRWMWVQCIQASAEWPAW